MCRPEIRSRKSKYSVFGVRQSVLAVDGDTSCGCDERYKQRSLFFFFFSQRFRS